MRRALPLLLLALAVPAAPADAPTLRLTLEEALGRARAHSPRLGQLAALKASAEASARGAQAGRWPSLDAFLAYTRSSDVPELTLSLPGQAPRTLFPNINDNYRLHAGLGVPLYTGGRLGGAIAAADQQFLAAEKDLEGAFHDLALETSQAFWSLVAWRESQRVLGAALQAFESHLKDARNRQDMGMAASNEVLAVQVERERAELSRLQAAMAAEVANANLQRLLGLEAGTRVEPIEPPPAEVPQEELEALVARAGHGRPELAALRARAAAARAAVRVARSAWLPQASLQAGYDYARPNSRVLPLADEWKGTWSVGASVSLNAFDFGRTSAAVAQAEAQADALDRQLEDLQGRIRQEVTARQLEQATASAALAVARRAEQAAEENVRVSRDRYREGVTFSSDLLDAEVGLLRAGLDRTLASAQLRVALANLDRAVGR
jgi:outer membrane protein TolC